MEKIVNYIKEGLLSLKTIKKDKMEYKSYLARVKKLPADYRKVFKEVNKYVWSYSDPSGKETMQIVGGLLELFEIGAAEGKPVKDITGPNVGEFADGLVQEIDHSWATKPRQKLNSKF